MKPDFAALAKARLSPDALVDEIGRDRPAWQREAVKAIFKQLDSDRQVVVAVLPRFYGESLHAQLVEYLKLHGALQVAVVSPPQ